VEEGAEEHLDHIPNRTDRVGLVSVGFEYGDYLGAFLKTTRIPGSQICAVSPWALAKA
jgi:hypothetical protein